MTLRYVIFIILISYFLSGLGGSVNNLTIPKDSAKDIVDIVRNPSNLQQPSAASAKTPISMTEVYLSLGVIAFGLVLVIFTGIIAFKKGTGWDQESTRVFTVSVIITAGLFLITAGYSDQQIAPMFGLLGTIVGYLLGKTATKEQSGKPE